MPLFATKPVSNGPSLVAKKNTPNSDYNMKTMPQLDEFDLGMKELVEKWWW